MHTQLFKKFDNDEGYISCIVHRERYLNDFKLDGWVESVDYLDTGDEIKPKAIPDIIGGMRKADKIYEIYRDTTGSDLDFVEGEDIAELKTRAIESL